jgi:Tol biopolymer transport system component
MGAALPVFEGVAMSSSPGGTGSVSGAAYYDIALEGSLVYSPREARFPKRSLVWVDRQGSSDVLDPLSRAYREPTLSPDGRRLAVSVIDADFQGVFVLDVERSAWTRITDVPGGRDIEWMPDGDRLLLGSLSQLMMTSASNVFPPETLYDAEAQFTAAVPDASAVLFCYNPAPAQWDIRRLPLTGNRTAEPFLTGPSIEMMPSFSPDGRWVAYRSDESGRPEIWVRPYPGPGPAHVVSNDTGSSPRWSRDGREIFFLSQGRLMSAAVRTGGAFSAESPRELFRIPEDIDSVARFYDVTKDGKRFVMVRKDPFELRPLELVMVPNWTQELEARMAGSSPGR